MIAISKQDNVTAINLGSAYEHINQDSISGLEAEFLELSQTADPPLIVINLSHTSFFASSFLALLVRAWRKVRSRGGQLALAGLTSHCREIITRSGLGQIWETFPSGDEAVRAFSSH